LFLNFRAKPVGGGAIDPYALQGNGTLMPLRLAPVPWQNLPALVRGRNVLFAVHGFNVSMQAGACALGNLETQFRGTGGMGEQDVFVAVLWPGDSWIPIVDYPFEGNVAVDCGKRLAKTCNSWFSAAQTISFVSHSLGARLLLHAVARLGRRVRSVCLTAAAIDRSCLTSEYQAAASNSDAIQILASHNDLVLRLAFPVGDPISDLLHPDHTPFQTALGYDGPPVPANRPVEAPWQIPDKAAYSHGDYLPPSTLPLPDPNPQKKWPEAVSFMGRAFRGLPQTWP
jgi:pimeloyl-ACP methyl ester carboxylesterase